MIIDKLWKLVAIRLDPLITITSDEIVKEQLDSYADVLREIMKYAPYVFHFIGGQRQDTKSMMLITLILTYHQKIIKTRLIRIIVKYNECNSNM